VTLRGHTPALVLVVAAAVSSCGKKSSAPEGPPPEVTGLAAVPASAEVIVAADVAKLANSQVVERALDQLLFRDSDLSARWDKLKASCKIDLVKQVNRVMIALGPAPEKAPGTGAQLMVATGTLVEAELQKCVQAMVGQGGGTLTAKAAGDHTLYQAKDGNRTLFFAFGRPDTVILGSNEAYVLEALGGGKKAPDNPDLAALLKQIDQRAPIWAAGKVPESIGGGLVRSTSGALSKGPQAFVATLDLTSGVSGELGAVMANDQDAKQLESFAKKSLGLIGAAAQRYNLQPVVDKVKIEASDTIVRFKASLSIDEINRVFCVLDGTKDCGQDASLQKGSDTK
jgi:hypothetical protein